MINGQELDSRPRGSTKTIFQMLLVPFVLCCALVLLGVFHIQSVRRIDSGYTNLLKTELSRLQSLQIVTAQTFLINRYCLNLLLAPPQSDLSEIMTKLAAATRLQQEAIKGLNTLEWNERDPLIKLNDSISEYSAAVEQFLGILKEKGSEPANEFRYVQMRPKLDQVNSDFGAIADSTSRQVLMTSEQASDSAVRDGWIGLFLMASPFILGLMSLIWFTVQLIRLVSRSRQDDELPV